MSTRIIIEKDGERYACDGLTIEIQNKSILYVSDGTANAMASYVTLPPVVRTDNSAVIANLEAENAKLRDEIIKVIAARNELLDLNRDCCDENDKLREVMKDLVIVAKNRMPTIPTVFECEAIGKAEEVI